ncbi:uncharacterized protein K452DRAFT_304964 [Aplosporella prunicola CBS 121167]|uniref:C2H2-type domain-containing protein n=1 Tax=Aplosporella prunicola CBS 121167 TaxID=1176127 RepID=A0A6A6BR91_9PEZI|nr:uncharacterized protein K452DRAFT_304964 [Aplosporella prunicola CBS 121167]KAF2145963.1 hypothetical protein K452DRAFT_304964 [Aplosporella prunicola CBS 121167]
MYLSENQQNTILREHKAFILWGDGFGIDEGELETVFRQSRRLRHRTLQLLSTTGKLLYKLAAPLLALTEAPTHSELPSLLEEVKISIPHQYDDSDDSDDSDDPKNLEIISLFSEKEISETLEDLKNYVQCLIELSPSLENPAKDPGWNEAVRAVEQKTTSSISQMPGCDVYSRLIQDRFPKAPTELIEMLGTLNWNRFLRLQSLRDLHASKLSGMSDDESGLESEEEFQELGSRKSGLAKTFHDSGLGTSVPAKSAYAPSTTTSVLEGAAVRVPPLPEKGKMGLPFTCDACGKTVIIRERRIWKKHIYRDLQPYTCVHADCKSQTAVFKDRQALRNHFLAVHNADSGCNPQQCSLCDESFPLEPVAFSTHLARHLEEIALAALPRALEPDSDIEGSADSDDESDMIKPNEPVTVEVSTEVDDLIPTHEGFERAISLRNPHIQSYLLDRAVQEQIRRYDRLLEMRSKHEAAIKDCSCPSKQYCLALGGNAKDLGFGLEHTSDEDAATETAQYPANVPPPPVNLPAEFECRFCFKVKKIHKASDWTKHVYEDIQPFTCTFAYCAVPKSFKRRADWVRHENERHRKLESWECNLEDCKHTCYRKDNFIQHLVREHKIPEPRARARKLNETSVMSGDSSDIWDIVEQCRRDTTRPAAEEPCKFCGRVFSTWKTLIAHLAKHMEQISLPTLMLLAKNPSLQQSAYQRPLAMWSNDPSEDQTKRLAAYYSLPVVPHPRDGRGDDEYPHDDTALELVPGYTLLEEDTDAVQHAPMFTTIGPETRFLPAYECSFDFLHCRRFFSAINVPDGDPEQAWRTHVLSHFNGHPPPRSVCCPLCDDFEYTDATPGLAWDKRMEHVAEHHRAGHTLAKARPDVHLYQYLWQKRIIDDAELKELKSGSAVASGNSGETLQHTQGSRIDEQTRRRLLHPRQ